MRNIMSFLSVILISIPSFGGGIGNFRELPGGFTGLPSGRVDFVSGEIQMRVNPGKVTLVYGETVQTEYPSLIRVDITSDNPDVNLTIGVLNGEFDKGNSDYSLDSSSLTTSEDLVKGDKRICLLTNQKAFTPLIQAFYPERNLDGKIAEARNEGMITVSKIEIVSLDPKVFGSLREEEIGVKETPTPTVTPTVTPTPTPAYVPVQWKVEDGGNGHWYTMVYSPQITWATANIEANALGGHLATVTTKEENDFIYSTFYRSSHLGLPNCFLGGYQDTLQGCFDPSLEPDKGWKWVTGEEFIYDCWGEVQPDNNLPHQDWIQYEVCGKTWIDTSLWGYWYMVEWEKI